MISFSIRSWLLWGAIYALTLSTDVFAQAGLNSGKPLITYNTNDPISIQTQSPPAFPGGEEKLVAFIRENMRDAQPAVKLGKKTWLTATIDADGKVSRLIPTYSTDQALQRELTRISALMPRWTPGQINQQGVETLYQFLIRR
jgi:hypothetical protein